MNPPQIRNLAGAFVDQYAQYFKVTFETLPLGTDIPWDSLGPSQQPTPRPPTIKEVDVVDETMWSVDGHPVPWVFHKNGTVEAPNIWKGTWSKINDGYLIKLINQ